MYYLNLFLDNLCVDCNKYWMKFFSWGIDVFIVEFSNYFFGKYVVICLLNRIYGWFLIMIVIM